MATQSAVATEAVALDLYETDCLPLTCAALADESAIDLIKAGDSCRRTCRPRDSNWLSVALSW